MTCFLTPREAKYARTWLSARLSEGMAWLWGGFHDAERVRAILCPDYLEGLVEAGNLTETPGAVLEVAGFEDVAMQVREAVTAVRICGSGYRMLTHRDYMGAILGLGLAREAIGDILVETDTAAVVLCERRMAMYLSSHLEKVGADTVQVCLLPPDAPLTPCRRTQIMQDTIASTRVDCLVAALCAVSREKAQSAIRGGLCEVEYEIVQDCDAEVEAPATLSVRGFGKFHVIAYEGETRKGRIRLRAEKYI